MSTNEFKTDITAIINGSFFFSLSTGHTTASFSQSITALYYGDGPLAQCEQIRSTPSWYIGRRIIRCMRCSLARLSRTPRRARFNRCFRVCRLGALFLTDGFLDYVWMGLPIAALFATLAVLLLLLLATLAGAP